MLLQQLCYENWFNDLHRACAVLRTRVVDDLNVIPFNLPPAERRGW